MTPEEKFNQEIWWILQELKKEYRATLEDEYVRFNYQTPSEKIPSHDDQRRALGVLQKEGAIKFIRNVYPRPFESLAETIEIKPIGIILEIFEKDFEKVYKKYQKACDLQSYLNNYQDSLLRVAKGEVKPKEANILNFAHVEPTQPEKAPIRATTPKNPSVIKAKTLELIAQEIGNLDTGTNLINFLTDCGVNNKLIEYPQTKWRMVYGVLTMLAASNEPKDQEVLPKIIEGAVHPLMHDGDEQKAKALQDKFNIYLKYDGFEIGFRKEGNSFSPALICLDAIARSDIPEGSEEYKDKISLLRKTYQTLMGVVEVFCRNFSRLSHEDTVELNKHYLALDKAVWDTIDELQLGGAFENYKKYPRPFTNLFSAEKELDGDISWNVIRREMSARFGEIETLYQRVNASDILAEPDKQKQLNDVTLYLSELKEKTKEVKHKKETSQPPAARIEITKMPELQIKGLKEIAKTQKGDDKPRFPHKLPAGTRWEEMTIKFLGDENVFIQVKQFKHNASYKEFGFVGKGNNPNPSEAWTFLRVLAKANGELTIKDAEAKGKYKKQKELLAKSLQSYFSLDYDPFYPYHSSSEKSGDSYKIKITLIPPPDTKKKTNADENGNDDLGIKEYLDEQNPQVYEDE